MGLGLLLKNESRLVSHNKRTLQINDSPYGLLIHTGRYPYPGTNISAMLLATSDVHLHTQTFELVHVLSRFVYIKIIFFESKFSRHRYPHTIESALILINLLFSDYLSSIYLIFSYRASSGQRSVANGKS